MALAYNSDQQMFRLSVSDALKRSCAVSTLRDWHNVVVNDDRVRAGVAGRLDLLPMTVPEAHGGGGFAFADIAAGIEQFGAGLLPGSTSPTLTAVLALVFGVSGEEATTAAAELALGGRAAVSACATQVRADAQDNGCFALTGRLPVVDGGTHATHVLCSANTSDGVGVFLVDTTAPSVTRQALTTLDTTRDACAFAFDATAAQQLHRPDGRGSLRVRAVAALVSSLECVGAMDALMTMATSYAKERFQFGRQIGSYQAVKHRLVTMQVELELARAATMGAVEQVDREDADLFVSAASASKAVCAVAGPFIAQEAIGVFGGIGYSWEHDAHLYFRRLNYLSVVHGGAAEHLDTVVDELTRKTRSNR